MTIVTRLFPWSLLAAVLAACGLVAALPSVYAAMEEALTASYGVDVSYPMHHGNLTVPNPLGGDKQTFYEDNIQKCVEHYGKKQGIRCIDNEKERIAMSLRQPQGMHNYTANGFTKIRAPDHVFQMIKEFWDANRDNARPENWPAGNTYVNHWTAPTESEFFWVLACVWMRIGSDWLK